MTTAARPTAVPVYLGQLVQNGTITSPVEFFDVTLPSGFSRFNFFFSGMTLTAPDPGDNIAAVLMTGGRFNNDIINNDSYFQFPAGSTSPVITLTPPQTNASLDFRAVGLFDIYPGDANNWPILTITYALAESKTNVLVQGLLFWTLHPEAVVTPFRGPATVLRVFPKGNSDCNPPTSGETINTGDWRLYAYN